MSDLINRQDVIEKAHLPTIEDAGYEVIRLDYILSLPSAEPERKKGKWVLATNFPYGDDCYVCINCKVKLDSMYPNFCPNCGADMREGEEE